MFGAFFILYCAGDTRWKDCQELLVGRIRNTPEWSVEETDVLSLSLFPGTHMEFSMDDRHASLSCIFCGI